MNPSQLVSEHPYDPILELRVLRFASIGAMLFLLTFTLLPLLDNITGWMGLSQSRSFSFPVRMLLMTVMAIVVMRSSHTSSLLLLCFLAALFLPILLRLIVEPAYAFAKVDFNRAAKTGYGVILTAGFYDLARHHRAAVKSAVYGLALAAAVYAAFVFIGTVFEVGLMNYGGIASSGFLIAGNDLSLVLAICGPIVLDLLSHSRQRQFLRLMFVLFYSYVLFSMFTKSGLLGIAVLWLVYWRRLERRTRIVTGIAFSILVVLAINFLLSGLVQSFLNLYGGVISRYGILGLLFRGRDLIVREWMALNQVLSPGVLDWLFGVGFGEFGTAYASVAENWGTSFKNAEMDPIDLLYAHGILGSIVTLSFYAVWTNRSFGKSSSNLGVNTSGPILIWWIHSIFAGHAISSPIVMTHMAAIFAVGASARKHRK